ncbi:hypothetical protein ACET3X_006189 [Alternaria dauci]|uniref:Uncharacterized protein n=1 Tax=Alternaria dauci TaxID=48095 RepID=A0ABR3UIZ0_9PLEO
MDQYSVLTRRFPAPFVGSYYHLQPVLGEITRDELRATAVTRSSIARKVIGDFCNSSERLEQIGAMVPTASGLQYWVKDSVTMEPILVAECYGLLQLVPEYRSRVPQEVRMAFEALNTPELRSRALLHSLSHYLQYIDWKASQAFQVQRQPLQIQGSRPQLPPIAPRAPQQPAARPIQPIVLTRAGHVAILQGPRTAGIRPGGVSGTHLYEWPESRKLAWFMITPRSATLPPRALSDSYCRFNSVALWEHVDLRLLGPNIQVNLVEIVAFFPRAASSWRALWKRFEAGGWSLSMLRMLIFYQRSLGTVDLRAHTFGSMKKHRTGAQSHACNPAGFTLEGINTDRVGARVDFNDLRDCFLFSLGDGLVHFPQGADQGVLTIAVLHARRHGHNNVRLSQLEQYITQAGLNTQYNLPGPSLVPVVQADRAARDRLFPDVTLDLAPRHDPGYNQIRRWWRAAGLSNDV